MGRPRRYSDLRLWLHTGCRAGWFFEITPDGIKRDHEVDFEDPDKHRQVRKLDQLTIATAVVLIIFVGLFSARYTADDPTPIDLGISATSVAVLPFENMSGDKDNEYFSDGLTETLLHMLAQIPDLKVAARTSSFAFKGQNKSIQEIAAELEVAHILEGSVQHAGDQIRITAQLIRASDGFHIWSKNFDREFTDVFAIQDEIATQVGNALSASLLGTDAETQLAGITTEDYDAYELYLQARKERATFSYVRSAGRRGPAQGCPADRPGLHRGEVRAGQQLHAPGRNRPDGS